MRLPSVYTISRTGVIESCRGEPVEFLISACDEFGNARPTGKDDFTVQVSGLHLRHPGVARLAATIEQATGLFVSINAYLSPPLEAVLEGAGASKRRGK